jgi:hypothetical protein
MLESDAIDAALSLERRTISHPFPHLVVSLMSFIKFPVKKAKKVKVGIKVKFLTDF